MIGYFEQSLFKLAENELQLAYIFKAKPNEVLENKFLKDNEGKEETMGQNEWEEEEQENDEVIGTI